jgi:tetratricopeptide (TPR) repeat protein
MPPEQWRGNIAELDERSDVYSLGIILYELLTGKIPFQGSTSINILVKQTKFERPLPPSFYNPLVAEDLDAICFKAIERQKENRYPTVRAFSEDIQRYCDGEPVSVRPWNWTEKIFAKLYKNLATIVAISLLAMVSIALAAGYLGQKEHTPPRPPSPPEVRVVIAEKTTPEEIQAIELGLADKKADSNKLNSLLQRLKSLLESRKYRHTEKTRLKTFLLCAQTYERIKNYSEAKKDYEQSLAILGKNVHLEAEGIEKHIIQARLALCAYHTKDPTAKEVLKKVCERSPQSLPPETLLEIAAALMQITFQETEKDRVREHFHWAYRVRRWTREEFRPLAEQLFSMAKELIYKKNYSLARLWLEEVKDYFQERLPFWQWLYFTSVCDLYTRSSSTQI